MKHNKLFSMSRILFAAALALAQVALSGVGLTHAGGSGAWTNTGSLNTARAGSTATLLANGQVLVAGGSAPGALSSAEIFDPGTGIWSPTGSLNVARYQHTATLLTDGRVLVVGGACVAPCPSPGASAEVYDPGSGTWTSTGNLNAIHNLHTATRLPNGQVLVAAGYNGTAVAGAELFDPATGVWTTTGSLNTARMRHTATLLPNGKVLVAGGTNGSSTVLASAELFNPATGTWTNTGSMKTNRVFHQATALPNGQVLVTGGCSSTTCTTILATTELYNSVTGKWSNTGRLVNVHGWGHTATLLSDGTVLVAAGCKASLCSNADSSVEVYNPSTGRWSLTGSLSEARYHHTATLLQDGEVLVAGGCGNPPCTRLATAELYAILP